MSIDLPHDRIRASFGLREYFREIDANDTDKGNDQAAQQPDRGHDGSPAAQGFGKKHPIGEKINRVRPRHEGDGYPNIKNADQRRIAERGDGVYQ